MGVGRNLRRTGRLVRNRVTAVLVALLPPVWLVALSVDDPGMTVYTMFLVAALPWLILAVGVPLVLTNSLPEWYVVPAMIGSHVLNAVLAGLLYGEFKEARERRRQLREARTAAVRRWSPPPR